MTERTFVDKNGNTWTWLETPEVLEALEKLHETKNDTKTETVG